MSELASTLPAPPAPPAPRRKLRILPWLLALFLLATLALLLWHGWSFYRLGLEERVEHPAFRELRPSGTYGNGYGFVGASLFVLNLLYLVRRRLASWRLGPMRVWLDVHVFTGLLGTTFVIFHSAFQARSTIASVTAAALAVTVATGIIGRFLHALVPKNGARLLADALATLGKRAPDARSAVEAALAPLPLTTLSARTGLLRSLATIPAWMRQRRARRAAVLAVAGELPEGRAAAKAAGAEVRAVAASSILRTWRVLHRLAALLMLLTVAVHVGIAWHYGYRWIFGS